MRNAILDISSAPAFQLVTVLQDRGVGILEIWLGKYCLLFLHWKKILFLLLFCYNVTLQYCWSPSLSKTAQCSSCLLKPWWHTQLLFSYPTQTQCMLKKTGHYQNPIALSHSQERAVTHFSLPSLPIFPKPVVTLQSAISIPPKNMATTGQWFQKLLVNM